eukprot:scaffold895_cov286-Prasinococcus_capsulatus_cf.AAC.5
MPPRTKQHVSERAGELTRARLAGTPGRRSLDTAAAVAPAPPVRRPRAAAPSPPAPSLGCRTSPSLGTRLRPDAARS